jgi:hypothetical protein
MVVEKMAWDKRYGAAIELLHGVPPSDFSKFVRNDPLSRLYRFLPSPFRFVVDVFRR